MVKQAQCDDPKRNNNFIFYGGTIINIIKYLHNTMPCILFLSIIFVIVLLTVHAITPHQLSHRQDVQNQRIIALSPSITAMIIDLECEHLLVGVTTFHPPLSKILPIVGTMTHPNIEKIIELAPDTIFISRDDAATQKIDQLNYVKNATLYILPVSTTFDDICAHYMTIAKILNKEEYAIKKLHYYKKQRQSHHHPESKKAIILISVHPLIAVSHHSYISNIFGDMGINNVITYSKSAYPIIQKEYLLSSDADIIIELCNEHLQQAITKIIPVLHIPYEPVYFYTPRHYCQSLQYIATFLYSQ
jgi:ABC-type Fe3+-hydroxamate transport system substrate-binding protein